jgi:zinc/manganese transport system permease protein
VPLLGLYLVFATLIVPALAMPVRAASRRFDRHAPITLGGLAYGAGLLASLRWDLPSGPCIVLALMLAGVAAARGTSAWRRPNTGD